MNKSIHLIILSLCSLVTLNNTMNGANEFEYTPEEIKRNNLCNELKRAKSDAELSYAALRGAIIGAGFGAKFMPEPAQRMFGPGMATATIATIGAIAGYGLAATGQFAVDRLATKESETLFKIQETAQIVSSFAVIGGGADWWYNGYNPQHLALAGSCFAMAEATKETSIRARIKKSDPFR